MLYNKDMSDKITWQNIRVKLGALIPWERNPKKITKTAARRLLKNLEDFGQWQDVAVGPDLEVYDGHQRLNTWSAAYGPDFEIDAKQSSRALAEDERERFVIEAHVGAVGQFDFDALESFSMPVLMEAGFDSEYLAQVNKDADKLKGLLSGGEADPVDAEPQIDRAAELNEKWGVVTGDLWKIGDHRLLCGDSTKREDVERAMGGENAEMVWTDPPYGVNYGEKLDEHNAMGYKVRTIENDNLPPAELEVFIRSALSNASEFCIDGAAIYVACPAGTLLPTIINAFVGSGFDFRWGLIWLKDQIVLSRADYHFKHENILYGWKPGAAHYFIDDRKQTSVFEYPRPKKSEEHPTMKPVELIQHMLRNSSRPGGLVIDMFGGSGSTMLAAQNEKRAARLVELSPNYCAVILERMATAFPDLTIERIE